MPNWFKIKRKKKKLIIIHHDVTRPVESDIADFSSGSTSADLCEKEIPDQFSTEDQETAKESSITTDTNLSRESCIDVQVVSNSSDVNSCDFCETEITEQYSQQSSEGQETTKESETNNTNLSRESVIGIQVVSSPEYDNFSSDASQKEDSFTNVRTLLSYSVLSSPSDQSSGPISSESIKSTSFKTESARCETFCDNLASEVEHDSQSSESVSGNFNGGHTSVETICGNIGTHDNEVESSDASTKLTENLETITVPNKGEPCNFDEHYQAVDEKANEAFNAVEVSAVIKEVLTEIIGDTVAGIYAKANFVTENRSAGIVYNEKINNTVNLSGNGDVSEEKIETVSIKSNTSSSLSVHNEHNEMAFFSDNIKRTFENTEDLRGEELNKTTSGDFELSKEIDKAFSTICLLNKSQWEEVSDSVQDPCRERMEHGTEMVNEWNEVIDVSCKNMNGTDAVFTDNCNETMQNIKLPSFETNCSLADESTHSFEDSDSDTPLIHHCCYTIDNLTENDFFTNNENEVMHLTEEIEQTSMNSSIQNNNIPPKTVDSKIDAELINQTVGDLLQEKFRETSDYQYEVNSTNKVECGGDCIPTIPDSPSIKEIPCGLAAALENSLILTSPIADIEKLIRAIEIFSNEKENLPSNDITSSYSPKKEENSSPQDKLSNYSPEKENSHPQDKRSTYSPKKEKSSPPDKRSSYSPKKENSSLEIKETEKNDHPKTAMQSANLDYDDTICNATSSDVPESFTKCKNTDEGELMEPSFVSEEKSLTLIYIESEISECDTIDNQENASYNDQTCNLISSDVADSFTEQEKCMDNSNGFKEEILLHYSTEVEKSRPPKKPIDEEKNSASNDEKYNLPSLDVEDSLTKCNTTDEEEFIDKLVKFEKENSSFDIKGHEINTSPKIENDPKNPAHIDQVCNLTSSDDSDSLFKSEHSEKGLVTRAPIALEQGIQNVIDFRNLLQKHHNFVKSTESSEEYGPLTGDDYSQNISIENFTAAFYNNTHQSNTNSAVLVETKETKSNTTMIRYVENNNNNSKEFNENKIPNKPERSFLIGFEPIPVEVEVMKDFNSFSEDEKSQPKEDSSGLDHNFEDDCHNNKFCEILVLEKDIELRKVDKPEINEDNIRMAIQNIISRARNIIQKFKDLNFQKCTGNSGLSRNISLVEKEQHEAINKVRITSNKPNNISQRSNEPSSENLTYAIESSGLSSNSPFSEHPSMEGCLLRIPSKAHASKTGHISLPLSLPTSSKIRKINAVRPNSTFESLEGYLESRGILNKSYEYENGSEEEILDINNSVLDFCLQLADQNPNNGFISESEATESDFMSPPKNPVDQGDIGISETDVGSPCELESKVSIGDFDVHKCRSQELTNEQPAVESGFKCRKPKSKVTIDLSSRSPNILVKCTGDLEVCPMETVLAREFTPQESICEISPKVTNQNKKDGLKLPKNVEETKTRKPHQLFDKKINKIQKNLETFKNRKPEAEKPMSKPTRNSYVFQTKKDQLFSESQPKKSNPEKLSGTNTKKLNPVKRTINDKDSASKSTLRYQKVRSYSKPATENVEEI